MPDMPVNVDATYDDQSPGDALHQQHHDTLHGLHNELKGSTALSAELLAKLDDFFLLLTGGTLTGDLSVPDEVYGAGWDGSTEVPTKNALYDKIETIDSGTSANDAALVATDESTTSGSFTDLTTPGPAVTVTTGTKALVIVSADIYNDTAGSAGLMGFAVSGATTLAADGVRALFFRNVQAAVTEFQASLAYIVEGLTAGSNTFTAKYQMGGSGTAHFRYRKISVVDMGS